MQKGSAGNNDDRNNSQRASEHPAPFNPGTLVREFGGSDRQTPSSGNTTATVPQALALSMTSRPTSPQARRAALARL
jgi:hypothetical protein